MVHFQATCRLGASSCGAATAGVAGARWAPFSCANAAPGGSFAALGAAWTPTPEGSRLLKFHKPLWPRQAEWAWSPSPCDGGSSAAAAPAAAAGGSASCDSAAGHAGSASDSSGAVVSGGGASSESVGRGGSGCLGFHGWGWVTKFEDPPKGAAVPSEYRMPHALQATVGQRILGLVTLQDIVSVAGAPSLGLKGVQGLALRGFVGHR